MKPVAWICVSLGLIFTQHVAADNASTPILIGNADNQITLQSAASVPQVLRLTGTDGAIWQGMDAETFIASATVDGVAVPLHWRFDPDASRIRNDSASLAYGDRSTGLRLYWEWRAAARHGPIEHVIRIENPGTHEVWIPLQDSFRFAWKIAANQPLEQLWIDKGAGEAPPVGTHLVPITEGYHWHGASSTYAHPPAGEPREIIPYFLVRDASSTNRGWYVGVEFSGRIAMELKRHGDVLEGVAGLNPEPGPFRTRLAPGETFSTPTMFVGTSNGDVDDTGNTLRRWVREVLNDPATLRDRAYPTVTINSWGSAMAITDVQARHMIDDASSLGFEMFHLDAGWFRAVGDWYPDPRKFPHGVAAISDYAHSRGLKFGLWVDWAQAGTSTQHGALSVADPRVRDWLTTDPPAGWKPAEFKGITIDLGVPAAQAWATHEVNRIVRDYHVDVLEHDGYVVAQGCARSDHPHAPTDPTRTRRYSDDDFLWVDGSNSTDVSLHATRAYYEIQTSLRFAHPGLMLEICNDGGRMVDFGSAAHGDYFSMVDSYDPLSNRQAFYDASHVLPPAMLEAYVKAWPTPHIENFRYMLRSGMMGWLTVMIDSNSWSPQQHAAAAREIAFYKSTLRPLIRDADLYHVGPRPDGKGWDGLEYFDASHDRGVLYAFHGSAATPGEFRFNLRGLHSDRRYRLHFRDHSSPDREADGRELMQSGVAVALPMADSSELVTIEALR
ncbi:alpha-galactosidase [Dyella sp. S184]|uniref:alpha-galactosidase n=1 Tax=Dyella sp. S184 TaxID=1641862 RepID=UPI00131E18D3|nr:alpha-galactosidase [Dyella sp. S184]